MQIPGYTITKTSELEAKDRNFKALENFADKLRDQRNEARAQLAHWKKHGQLRDPATGRLIPKAAVTTEAV